jgi:hypothetical protein
MRTELYRITQTNADTGFFVSYNIETISEYGAMAHLYGLATHYETLGMMIHDKTLDRENMSFSVSSIISKPSGAAIVIKADKISQLNLED